MLFSFRPIAIFVRFNERFKAFTLFRKTIGNFLLAGHNRISIEFSDKSSFKLSAAYHTNGHLIESAQIFKYSDLYARNLFAKKPICIDSAH